MGMRKFWCKHYNGTVNERCRVGVRYEDVKKTHDPMPTVNDYGRETTRTVSLPCFRLENPAGATCDQCVFRTAEEIAEAEAESNRRMERMGKARGAIVAALGGPWDRKKNRTGGSGRIACPNCAGVLSYSRSGHNGHIHAKCSTAECAAWME